MDVTAISEYFLHITHPEILSNSDPTRKGRGQKYIPEKLEMISFF
jgi:hypothetical protein